MHVIIEKAPIFTVTPHNLYLRKLGESIEIPCDALDGDSAHRPIILWNKVNLTVLPQLESTTLPQMCSRKILPYPWDGIP